MAKRQRRKTDKKRKSRKQTRRRRQGGGNYQIPTTETLEGIPTRDDAVVTMSNGQIMSVAEFKKLGKD